MFVFSVCRLVSRRCHNIPAIHQLYPSPSQNRACAINAHGSSHGPSRGIVRAFLATRRSLVVTASPLLGTDGVSSRRSTMCRLLSSRGITPLHGYYKAIRLPTRDKPLLPFTIVGTLSHPWKRAWGLPGCRDILVSCMPWSKTPGKCAPPGHPGGAHVDFRLCNDVVLPNSFFRGSIPSTL